MQEPRLSIADCHPRFFKDAMFKIAAVPPRVRKIRRYAWRLHGANGSEKLPLTGGTNMAETEGFGFAGKIVTANLTPEGKLADYTDGKIFRAIH